jgi:hypothetical protein
MAALNCVFRTERDKAAYLLIIILVHNLIYPFSTGSGIEPIIFYAVFSSMFIIAVWMLNRNRREHVVIAVSGGAVFVCGVINAYVPGTSALPLLYIAAIVYHLTMISTLVRYIFVAKRVVIEVVLAAASLYFIIGSLFTATFGFIEWSSPGSFVASTGAAISWQQLLYYSYVTLTTVGYGDIIPVRYYAQSAAVFEAVTGVLYTVILLSRLVSVYESERQTPPGAPGGKGD